MKSTFVFVIAVFLLALVLTSCSSQNEKSQLHDKKLSEHLKEYPDDYLPKNKVFVKYPSKAIRKKMSGYCTVQYTVTKEGKTAHHEVIDCSNDVFVKTSIRAAKKFRYEPKVRNGEPVDVPGVRNSFTFDIH
ncbi:MAG: hypothetical protein COA42_13845 [Alteromonadaceae bacterium]|nr:MAG: hypothetical protein COA42_13845 [Alteromonadaceae bacterium]